MSTAPSPSASGTKKRKVIASPIRPSVLSWVIEESGYGQAELAASVGISASDLAAWANGDEVAPRGAVSKILRKLHRSPDMVYLDEVPEEARLKAHFRTMKVAGGTVPLTPEEVRVIREAHYVQYIMSDIMRRSETAPVDTLRQLRLDELPNIESQGRQLRTWAESGAAPRRGRSFGEWRSLVEERSVFVMMIDIRRPRGWSDVPGNDPSRLRGFSLPDEYAPLIVVCTDYPPAKTFTLFHELAHLGFPDEPAGSCHVPINGSDATERLCDQIAGSALLPLDDLRAYVDANVLRDRPDLMVNRVSREFQVSMRAAALAIEDGLGYSGLYRRTASMCAYRDRFPRRKSDGGPGFRRVDLRLRKFGRGFVQTLMRLWREGSVNEKHVRRLLKMDRVEIYEAAYLVGVDIP